MRRSAAGILAAPLKRLMSSMPASTPGIEELLADEDKTKRPDIKIVDFLLQTDVGGRIRYGACKNILKVIGDYDDNILYGYCGRPDCAKFADFKSILQDCVDTKSDMIWS